jgi:hypothetical protein
LQGQFGLASDERSAAPELLSGGGFASPYLALADGGDGVALAQRLDDGWSLRVGLARAGQARQDPYGSGDNTVMVGELVAAGADRWRLGLQFGQVAEQGRLLDAGGGGALGLPDAASTTFLGLAARAELPARLALFGQGNFGLTRAHGAGHGLLLDVSISASASCAATSLSPETG